MEGRAWVHKELQVILSSLQQAGKESRAWPGLGLGGLVRMPIPLPTSLSRPSLSAHQAIHRPVVGCRGEDDHIQAVDEEVEVEDALDKSVPFVLQESVQRFHQKHVVAVLRGAERGEAHSPARNHKISHPRNLC